LLTRLYPDIDMSSPFALRLLLAHFFVTSALAGLIWTIQVVHYPLFAQVGRDGFVAYEQSHSSRISMIVGPLMGAEFLCALAIVWKRPFGISPWLAFGAFGVLLVVHATTMVFSVPAHNILGKGFNAVAHRRLVQTNWVRTIGWTARAGLAAYMVSAYAGQNLPTT
jgi:hypothetical protein